MFPRLRLSDEEYQRRKTRYEEEQKEIKKQMEEKLKQRIDKLLDSDKERVFCAIFDADGCMFNLNYYNLRKEYYERLKKNNLEIADPKDPKAADQQHLIEANKELFGVVSQLKNGARESICYIGSNRQSLDVDFTNRQERMLYDRVMGPSIFPTMVDVCEYLDLTFNSLLMADVENSLDAGTAYLQAMEALEIEARGDKDEIRPKAARYSWSFDLNKVSLMYLYMHDLAKKHPEKKITCAFFDDREDILEVIAGYFIERPHRMPMNVSLSLFHYSGGPVKVFNENLVGKGQPDECYKETVRMLITEASLNYKASGGRGCYVDKVPDHLFPNLSGEPMLSPETPSGQEEEEEEVITPSSSFRWS